MFAHSRLLDVRHVWVRPAMEPMGQRDCCAMGTDSFEQSAGRLIVRVQPHQVTPERSQEDDGFEPDE